MFRISASRARRLGISTNSKGIEAAAGQVPRSPSPSPAPRRKLRIISSPAALSMPEPTGTIAVVIVGRPTAKEAVRSGDGRFYKPKRTSDYEAKVRAEAELAMRGFAAFSGPVALRVVHYRRPLKRWSKADRAAALAGEILPDTKPDTDNLEKSLFDALKTVVFEDDAQVCQKLFLKRFGEDDRVVVRVRALPVRGIRRPAA